MNNHSLIGFAIRGYTTVEHNSKLSLTSHVLTHSHIHSYNYTVLGPRMDS